MQISRDRCQLAWLTPHNGVLSVYTIFAKIAWDRGDHWEAAMRKSIATYDGDFQTSLRAELAKGVTELGFNPVDYDLVEAVESPSDPRTK